MKFMKTPENYDKERKVEIQYIIGDSVWNFRTFQFGE